MQKIVRRESLGAVHTHTHTHTHTSNLKKEEKRVGENSTLKGMEKRRTEKGSKLFNCLSFLRALHQAKGKNRRLYAVYKKEINNIRIQIQCDTTLFKLYL